MKQALPQSIIKIFLYAIGVAAVLYVLVRTVIIYSESRITGDRAPYLQQVTAHSVIIKWNTESPERGVVVYGKSIGQKESIIIEPWANTEHEVLLEKLQPGTRYFYAVGNQQSMRYAFEGERWFMTAPASESGFDALDSNPRTRVWVIGDSGYAGKTAMRVRDAAKKWMWKHSQENEPLLNVWLSLGDLAYVSASNSEFQASLFDMYPDLLKRFALWPTYGNHDARRWVYDKIFSLPTRGEAGGVPSGSEYFYSFDYRDVHFVVLNTQSDSMVKNAPMLAWLKKDLKQNAKRWIIAAVHHPPYSKGSHDSDSYRDSWGRMIKLRENVLPLLEKYSVDLVLSGHSHVYERSHLIACHYGDSSEFSEKNIVDNVLQGQTVTYEKNSGAYAGTVYVVAGASSKVDKSPVDHPVMARSLLNAGSLVVDIEKNKLTASYIGVVPNVLDQFTILKNDTESGKTACN